MENASKALVIAGAILIVIVLIGIGVIVVNSTNGMEEQASSSADSMALQTFNSQFTEYDGKDVSASHVRSLISTIKASNASNAKQVKYDIKRGTTNISTVTSGKLYTVSVEYILPGAQSSTEDGYVQYILITEQ